MDCIVRHCDSSTDTRNVHDVIHARGPIQRPSAQNMIQGTAAAHAANNHRAKRCGLGDSWHVQFIFLLLALPEGIAPCQLAITTCARGRSECYLDLNRGTPMVQVQAPLFTRRGLRSLEILTHRTHVDCLSLKVSHRHRVQTQRGFKRARHEVFVFLFGNPRRTHFLVVSSIDTGR